MVPFQHLGVGFEIGLAGRVAGTALDFTIPESQADMEQILNQCLLGLGETKSIVGSPIQFEKKWRNRLPSFLKKIRLRIAGKRFGGDQSFVEFRPFP